MRFFRVPARRVAALCCTSALLVQGCYASVVAPPSGPAPTGEVHVLLTTEGAASLVSILGPRATALDGHLAERSDAGLALLVTKVTRSTGTEEAWPAEQVRVPAAAVREVWVRRFSRNRSILLAALVGGAAYLAGHLIGGTEGSGGTRTPDPAAGK